MCSIKITNEIDILTHVRYASREEIIFVLRGFATKDIAVTIFLQFLNFSWLAKIVPFLVA